MYVSDAIGAGMGGNRTRRVELRGMLVLVIAAGTSNTTAP